MKKLCIFVAIFGSLAFAQSLPRKAFFGMQTEALSDSVRAALHGGKSAGVRVQKVVPAGTAELLKLQTNDIVLSINAKVISKPEDIPAMQIVEGDEVTVSYIRGGVKYDAFGKAVEKPREQSGKFAIQYDAVPFEKGLLRTIVTKPITAGKHPAILLIQGYTCSPVCDLPDWHPYRKLTDGLTEAGYLVMRVEKPGVGETSNVPDCVQMDIFEETEAFTAAYTFMKNLPDVDSSKLFIWGHSMGGKIGPAIAARFQPAGVIIYGSTHEYWSEYLFKMIRAQNVGFGTTGFAETEKDLAAYRTIFYRMCVEKKHPKRIAEEDSAFGMLMKRDLQWDGEDLLFGRSYKFFYSVEDMNTTLDLLEYKGKVLAMYGEADVEVFEPEGMKRMAEIVNTVHPGNGTFIEIPKTDHAFLLLGNLNESFKIRADLTRYRAEMKTKFNPAVVEETDKWIRKVLER